MRSDSVRDRGSRRIWVAQNVRLPQAEDVPASNLEGGSLFRVALDVPGDFGDPVPRISALLQASPQGEPVTAMPEVTIDEDDDSCGGEDHVRSARQSNAVLTVAKAEAPDSLTKDQLCTPTLAPVFLLDAGCPW